MFRCALTELETIEISVATDGSSTVAQLPIGYEAEPHRRYSLFAAFDTVPGRGPDTRELVFCLLEHDVEEDVLYRIWDSRETRHKIPKPEDRAAVLGALRQVIRQLIDDARPRVVIMHTREAHLPQRALRRYAAVCSVFDEEGYRVGSADPFHGRLTWMMERTA